MSSSLIVDEHKRYERKRFDYDESEDTSKVIPEFNSTKQWKFIEKVNIEKRSTEDPPRVTGCCSISDTDDFLLCDNKNCNLKRVRRSGGYAEVALPGAPFDIHAFGKYAVVSIPEAKLLQFLDIEKGLKLMEDSDIKLEYAGYGVCVAGDKIYVCFPEAGIQVVSLHGGEMLQLIASRKSNPTYIEVSSDNSTIFCFSSEPGGRHAFVDCLTTREDYLYQYSNQYLKQTGSLIADSKKNLLVLERGSKYLHLVNGIGNNVWRKELYVDVKTTQGATAMCYDKRKNELLIVVESQLLFCKQTNTESWVWDPCTIL